MPQLGDSPGAIVGLGLDKNGHASRPIAFVSHILDRCAGDFPGSSLDGVVDRILGHIQCLGVVDCLAQSCVPAYVSPAHARRYCQFLYESRERFTALGIDGPLFVLNRMPFRMSRHCWSDRSSLEFCCNGSLTLS